MCIERWVKFTQQGWVNLAKRYRKGLYKYEHDAKSEFKEWVADVPGECYVHLLREWRKRNKSKKDGKDMETFLERECSKWARY